MAGFFLVLLLLLTVAAYYVIFGGLEKMGKFLLVGSLGGYLSLWLAFGFLGLSDLIRTGNMGLESFSGWGKGFLFSFLSPGRIFGVLGSQSGLKTAGILGLIFFFIWNMASVRYENQKAMSNEMQR